jgi:hypothetical protein
MVTSLQPRLKLAQKPEPTNTNKIQGQLIQPPQLDLEAQSNLAPPISFSDLPTFNANEGAIKGN